MPATMLFQRGSISVIDYRQAAKGDRKILQERLAATPLAALIEDIGAGRVKSTLPEAERFDLVLGITCHAVYHAGQVQLIKRLHGE
jgi:hypothetical protein